MEVANMLAYYEMETIIVVNPECWNHAILLMWYDNDLRLIIDICSYENIPHSIFNQSACVSL